jgi:transposase
LLPPQKPKTGRPNKDHRTVLSGIIRILRTGAPWRALPERFGSPKTVSSRFSRWGEHVVDGTVVRAHQQAAHRSPRIRRPSGLKGWW